MDFQITDRINDMQTAAIERLARPDDPLTTFGWLRTYEQLCDRRRIQAKYLVACDDGSTRSPVAILPMFFYKSTGTVEGADGLLFGRFALLARRVGLTVLPHLKVGIPLSSSFALCKNGSDHNLQQSVLTEAKRIALNSGDSLFLNKIEVGSNLEGLVEGNFLRINAPDQAYLRIQWVSLQEYIEWLDANRFMRRKEVRREIRKPEKCGTVLEKIDSLRAFDLAAGELARLFRRTYLDHGAKYAPYDEDFFRSIRRNMGGRVVAYVSYNGERMTASVLVLKSPKVWMIGFGGHERESTRQDLSWMNVVFYRPILDAIEAGIERIEYGSRAYDYKFRRGCKLRNTNAYLFIGSRLKRVALSTYSVLANRLLQRKYGTS